MSKLSTLLAAACLLVLSAVAATQAATHRHAASHRVHGLRAPRLLTPSAGAHVQQLTTLTWSAVPGAIEYLTAIPTDEGRANVVGGSAPSPLKTDGSVFALPSTLSEGAYYWAITPVDALGHRGRRSAVGRFMWFWPSATTANVVDLSSDPRVYEPEFKWLPVPGAARYEVEVNS